MALDVLKLTDAFFAAIERGDWEDVERRIHPEARAMQNVVAGGRESDARQTLAAMQGLVSSMQGVEYRNRRSVVGVDAVAEQHDVCMTRRDGREIVLDVCIILRFGEDGRIVRLDEYLDSAAAAALA